jgi:hypothetical protein
MITKRFAWALALCILPTVAMAQHDSQPETIARMGWWGPPSQVLEIFRYRNGGFTHVTVPYGTDYSASMPIAATGGMDGYFLFPRERKDTPSEWASFARLFPNCRGWVLQEEAKPSDVAQLAADISALRQLEPSRKAFATLSGQPSNGEWLIEIPKLIDAGMPVVCFQHYPFGVDWSTDETTLFRLLSLGRHFQNTTDAEHWAMIQVTPFGRHRQSSESDIRFQAYSALAYGAKALCFYAYWDPPYVDSFTNWGPAMIDSETHEAQYGFERVMEMNMELSTLGPFLSPLRSTGVYFVGKAPRTVKMLPQGHAPFTRIVATEALVGYFEDEAGDTWALLVNRRHGNKWSSSTSRLSAQVFVHPSVRSITEIDRLNGFEKPIPIDDGNFFITLPGGTGSLLRIKMGEEALP